MSAREIKRRFPSHADLVDLKPPSVDQIKATLHPDEALLSFFSAGRCSRTVRSLLWKVPLMEPLRRQAGGNFQPGTAGRGNAADVAQWPKAA